MNNKLFNEINFGDKAFLINSRGINPKNYFKTDTFTYIDIDAVKGCQILQPKTIHVSEAPSRAKRLIKKGDVLISSVRPYLKGFTYVNDAYDNCVASTGFFVIEETGTIYPPYFLYFALSDRFIEQTNSLMKGANYPAINSELFSKIIVSVPYKDSKPDVDEQKRIANKLSSLFSEIDKAIEKTKKALNNCENLINSELERTFGKKLPSGWVSLRFGDYSEFAGGRQPPKSTFKYEQTKGFVRLLQIRDFSIREQPVYVSQNNNLTYVEKDDVLIARYGASVGKILTGKKGAINVAIIKTIPKKGLSKRFMYWYLNSPVFQKYITSIPGRMAQAGFDKSALINLYIPSPANNNTPDVSGQEDYSNRMDNLQKQNEALRNKLLLQIVQFELLKQSLLNQAFEGKL